MSFADIVRAVSVELAKRARTTEEGWRWAPGVVVFPDIRCPYCKTAIQSKAIWKHTDRKLLGAVVPVVGETPQIVPVNHPHDRLEWGNRGICWGSAKTAHQALFLSLNPKSGYRGYVVPFLRSDLMGNHECDVMPRVKSAYRQTDRYTPEDFEEFVYLTCGACAARTKIKEAIAVEGLFGKACVDCAAHYKVTCSNCNATWYTVETALRADPKTNLPLCHHCFYAKYITCASCKKAKSRRGAKHTIDGYCCLSCFKRKYAVCSYCRSAVKTASVVGNKCEYCTPVCVTCGVHYDDDDATKAKAHKSKFCPDCGEYYHTKEKHTC